MQLSEYEELTRHLEKDYVLYQKTRWWYFFGGAIAVVAAAGFVSYEAGKKALESEAVEGAIKDIQEYKRRAHNLVEKLEGDARKYPEFQLPTVAGTGIHGWKELLKIEPNSAIKFEAISVENSYIQPWVIYAWRAYEQQNAKLYVVPLPSVHPGHSDHAAAIDWQMLPNGTIQVRTAEYETPRQLRITRMDVLRGQVVVYPQK